MARDDERDRDNREDRENGCAGQGRRSCEDG